MQWAWRADREAAKPLPVRVDKSGAGLERGTAWLRHMMANTGAGECLMGHTSWSARPRVFTLHLRPPGVHMTIPPA